MRIRWGRGKGGAWDTRTERPPGPGMCSVLDICMASNLPREGQLLAQDHTASWPQNLNSQSRGPLEKPTLLATGEEDSSLRPMQATYCTSPLPWAWGRACAQHRGWDNPEQGSLQCYYQHDSEAPTTRQATCPAVSLVSAPHEPLLSRPPVPPTSLTQLLWRGLCVCPRVQSRGSRHQRGRTFK